MENIKYISVFHTSLSFLKNTVCQVFLSSSREAELQSACRFPSQCYAVRTTGSISLDFFLSHVFRMGRLGSTLIFPVKNGFTNLSRQMLGFLHV